jgi:hypothetical protein
LSKELGSADGDAGTEKLDGDAKKMCEEIVKALA